jgi:putative ABC transport system permease protein
VQPSRLVRRGLSYYWRTNAAVVLGVGTAVAVLAGALLVGDSVRGSLRDLVLQRLGRTDLVVISSRFFRESLGDDLHTDPDFAPSFRAICPVIVVQGLVSDQASGRRASRVQVYGVDDRFWRFHGVSAEHGPEGRDALLSRKLASDIGAAAGTTALVRVELPSAIPIESLHGRKENLGRTLPLTVRSIVGPDDLGDFSLQPHQGEVRAVFVPLKRLQQDLNLDGLVNALVVTDAADRADRPDGHRGAAGVLEALVKRRTRLEDVGLTVRLLRTDPDRPDGVVARSAPPRALVAVESASGLLDQVRATAADAAARDEGMTADPVLTYLVNSLRSGRGEVPYSLVAATDLHSIAPLPALATDSSLSPPIVLNEWAARELGVTTGDSLTLEYYVWEEPGRLLTRTADFRVAAVVPISGAAADRNLAPVYPGITEAENLRNWDPPFPIDLRRIRRADEEYWRIYRTTPKAFIPLRVGQALWRSRYGDRTSVRITPRPGQSPDDALDRYAERLRARVDPLAMGLSVQDVRAQGLASSRGATDFGAYFVYFSFFLVMSALLLAALFFRLGVEQRAREVGLLRSVGFTTTGVRRLFLGEGLVLAAIGGVLGMAGSVAYGYAMMAGLRTWWTGAVGTTALRLHVSAVSLAAGAAGGALAATVCIWSTLAGLARLSERSLLAGRLAGDNLSASGGRASLGSPLIGAIAFALVAASLTVTTLAGGLDRTAAFFGAGTALLVSCLCLIVFVLRRPARRPLDGRAWCPVARLGLRNASNRPGRSVLAIAVIASATFILIAVDAFRREGPPAMDRHSGVGGYSLLVETLLPLVYDPNSAEGREALGLGAPDAPTIEPFRVLPGDDASCLNLYQPTSPRILGASRRFIGEGRFRFQSSLASSDVERANPWLILDRALTDGIPAVPVIPVIVDANSMTYVLHKNIGDDIVITRDGGPARLRIVAALTDSIFQGELVMSESNFLKMFPEQEGYRFLLVDVPEDRAGRVTVAINQGAADLGAVAEPTIQRLAEFHAVENTYLSTFQTLGGLGLLIGTVGLAAVLLRNVLERRRELALLGACGYSSADVFAIVAAENALLLGLGLGVGTLCALVAIAPAVADRGGHLPAAVRGWWLLVAVCTAGLLSSILATSAALRAPLLGALRGD